MPRIITNDDSAKVFLTFRKVISQFYLLQDKPTNNNPKQLTQYTQEIITAINSGTYSPDLPRTIIHDILSASSLPPSEKTFTRIYDEKGALTGAAFETTAHVIRIVL